MNISFRVQSVVLVAVLALIAFASPASANHSWNGYHWARTANPSTIKLGDNVDSTWDKYLTTTSSDWSKSTVLDTSIVSGAGGKRCRATTGRVEVCNSTYGNNGWLGLASISLSGGHIVQGTAKMNDTYFNQAQYNNSAEREHVMCQEVGHTFGLDHQSTDGTSLNTCMDYYQNTSSSDTKSIHPNQHDYDELATIYQHLDNTTTIGVLPAEMTNGDFNSRAEWGKSVKKSKDGRVEVFERDFGNDHKMIFFVIWAVPQ